MFRSFKRKSSSKKEAKKKMAETSDENVQPRDGELVVAAETGDDAEDDPEKQTKRDIMNEYMYVPLLISSPLTALCVGRSYD
jgi:fatty acid-binding protein DegV